MVGHGSRVFERVGRGALEPSARSTASVAAAPAAATGSVLLRAWLRTKAPSSSEMRVSASMRASAGGDAVRFEAPRPRFDPCLEHLGGGHPESLVRAGHLERHRGDRARHGEVGRLEGLRSTLEDRSNRTDHVGRFVPYRLDQRLEPGARGADGHVGQLVLAPGEVVVERGVRGTGLGQDLLDPGPGESLPLEQGGTRLDEPVSGVGHGAPCRILRRICRLPHSVTTLRTGSIYPEVAPCTNGLFGG